MSTVVRSVRKVVLFVLVLVVSGVGVAQAQTDPDVVPTSAEAVIDDPAAGVITPDAVRQSARLYATTEQASRAITSGNTEYWFSETLSISERGVDHYTEWAFYKINGREDNFFVDTYSTATGRGDRKILKFEVRLGPHPYSGTPLTARLQEYEPNRESQGRAHIHLPGGPVTFSMNYQGASIARTFHASPNTRLYSHGCGGGVCHALEVGHWFSENRSETLTAGSVSRWEGGPPWGLGAYAEPGGFGYMIPVDG